MNLPTGTSADHRAFARERIDDDHKRIVWEEYTCVEPQRRPRTRELGGRLGVSHATVTRWDKALQREYAEWYRTNTSGEQMGGVEACFGADSDSDSADLLQEIEKITGSRAKSLHGALADSGNPGVAACPDSISKAVADYYAMSECGRLFHGRGEKVTEIKVKERGVFRVQVGGECWEIARSTLLERLFPDRKIESKAEIDWVAFRKKQEGAMKRGEDGPPIPGMENDPLRQRGDMADSTGIVRVLNRTPGTDEFDSGERLFYGP